MLSRAETGRKRGKQESAGKLSSDSRGMHLEKALPKASFAGSGAASLASGRTPPSKPKTRADEFDDISQKEKKSLWNWKPLKVFANSRNRKFKCCFSLKVHTIMGLPSRFENSSLRVHWRMRDDELSTRSAKVIDRIAEFEESLTHNCVVHGRSVANQSAKYDAKQFTLYPSVVGAKHLDLGKHKVELTRLFPLTLEELEDEKSTGTWTTSFKLSGEARGAVINVSFGYTVTADASSSNGNRRVGDESANAKQIVAKTKNVVNRGGSLLEMLADNSHELPKLGDGVNANNKLESPRSEVFSEIELRNDGKHSYDVNDIKDFPLICSEIGLEVEGRNKVHEKSVEAAIVGNNSLEIISPLEEVNHDELQENIEGSLLVENNHHNSSYDMNEIKDFPLICSELGLEVESRNKVHEKSVEAAIVGNNSREIISPLEEVNHNELQENTEGSLLVENHSHNSSEIPRLNSVTERLSSYLSDHMSGIESDHEELHVTVPEISTLKDAIRDVPKFANDLKAGNEMLSSQSSEYFYGIEVNQVEFDEQEKRSSILGSQPHELDATNEVPSSLFSEEICGVQGSHIERAEDSSMSGNYSNDLSNLEDDLSPINEISLIQFSEILDEMEEHNDSHDFSNSEGFVNTVNEKLSPSSSEMEISYSEFEGIVGDEMGVIIKSSPTCSDVVAESENNQKGVGADVLNVSDVLNAINELLSATETMYDTIGDQSANVTFFHNHEKSDFSVGEVVSEVEESYEEAHSKLGDSVILDNYHNRENIMNQTQSTSSLEQHSERRLGSDRFQMERSESGFLNERSHDLEDDGYDEVDRDVMFSSILSREFISEIDVTNADNVFSGASDNHSFEAHGAYPERVELGNVNHGGVRCESFETLAVPAENTSVGTLTSGEQKLSIFPEDDAEDVANDFLDMLGINDTEDEPESPRECLLREFERDGFAFLDDDNPNPPDIYDRFSISDEFDLDSILRDMEQEAPTVDETEPVALTRDFVFNEDSFQSPPPTAPHVEDPAELPSLGEGLGSFVQTKNGGFLRSMSPTHFKKEGSLIMQVSSPVVIPAELGSDASHIIQGLASIGVEKLSMQANKLMPLDDIAGKTMHQVAFEAGASQVKRSHANECVTLDELAPLAMEKIEALSMEGLKFQSGVSECSHVTADGTAGVRLLQVNDTAGEVDGLMGMSLSLDQWMRLDSGDFGNENDVVSEETSKILAAHGANSLDSIRGKKRRSGLLGNTFTVSLLVQLRDPLRDFEAVGTPMLALVQVERVFGPPKPKIYYNVSSSCRKEDEDTEEVKEKEKFVISDVHVAGLENESGKEKVWGTASQQKCGSRWLLANGMGKSSKSAMPLPKTTNTLWSLSSKPNSNNPSVSKWNNAAKMGPSFLKNHPSRKLR